MSALVKQLRLLQAWYLPAGPEPEEAMPSKYRAFKEAADRIVELERDLATRDAELSTAKEAILRLDESFDERTNELIRANAKLAEWKRKAEESARDAARYRFIRDDDNWQDDAPDTATWDNLGELSMAEFDAAVDKKMSAAYWEKNPIQAAIAAKGEA